MQQVKFTGNGFEYFKIWIVNVLLTIVTLSLYYPWAKVRNYRYFYANTQVGEHNFEYHATGKQLFLGYLIAIVLLVAYVLFQQLSPIVSAVILIVFFIGFPWIIWKSLQFNLKMTSYANVRFSFTGGLGDAYINFLALLILAFVAFYAAFIIPFVTASAVDSAGVSFVLGLALFIGLSIAAVYAFAYKRKMNTEYLVNNRKFGNGSFSTSVETSVFVKIFFKTLLITLGVFLLLFVVIMAITAMFAGIAWFTDIADSMGDQAAMQNAIGSMAFLILPIYIGLIAVSLFVSAYMVSRVRNYIYQQSNLDEKITFQSTVKARDLTKVLLTNLLIIVFTLGLGTPWAKVRLARFYAENTLVETDVDISEYVSVKQQEQSSLGDQIGDAFDVDVGIAL